MGRREDKEEIRGQRRERRREREDPGKMGKRRLGGKGKRGEG